MPMLDHHHITKIKVPVLLVLMAGVWCILGMVYFDRFPGPASRLELVLMPWKESMPRQANLDQRLTIMQQQLDASSRVSSYSFAVLVASFAALTGYLSIIYQQKQRRAQENMLLTLKNREIVRRNEFIRYISATIGHEFKNNLGRIKRRIELLQGVPFEAKKRIDDNLDKLFADIEIFKKIADEREAGLVEFVPMDLKEMLHALALQYGDLAEIEIRESVALHAIYASPSLIRSVFENVFDNAVKYKKHEQARSRILVSCATDQDGSRRYATISIRDEGAGMDEQQADRCFYKGRGSGESWGQGLYFAKYVVGLHAGKIKVGKEYTTPGKGTEIIISLPLVEESQDV